MKTNIIKSIYNNIVLLELRQEYVDEINSVKRELPFNNIFNNKLRIVIPVTGSEMYNELKDELKKIPNFYSFDPNKKEIIRKIKVKTPSGEQEKNQVLSLGTVIQKLKIPEDKKKEFLNFYSQYSTNIEELEKTSKYSIILSRHPIDIARMSDAGNITSCHSQGGTYFRCAINEAKTGGPIAYLVKTEDLANLNEKTFQEGEIFKDDERDVDGINPVARIRIRRYSVEVGDDFDIAIPELRVYGRSIDGFYQTVKSYLKKEQENLISGNDFNELFVGKGISRRGGTYSDSSDSSLFNSFFDSQSFYGSVPMHSDDADEEGKDRADQMDEELREFHDRYDFKYSSVHYDVDDSDGQVYYIAFGSLFIDLTDYPVIDNFSIEISDGYQFNKYMRSPNKENRFDIQRDPDIELFMNQFRKLLPSALHSDFAGIQYVKTNKGINLYYTFNDGDSSTSENTDDYLVFLRNIEAIEEKYYDQIKSAVINALYYSNNLKAKRYIEEKNSLLDQYNLSTLTFNNIDYDDMLFTYTVPTNKKFKDFYIDKAEERLLKLFKNAYSQYKKELIKNNSSQLSFSEFTESFNLNLDGFNIKVNVNNVVENAYGNTVTIEIVPVVVDEDFLGFMKFLDDIANEITVAIGES